MQLCKSPSAYSRTRLTLNRIGDDESNTHMGVGAATHVERRICRLLHPQFIPQKLPRWVLLFPAVVLFVVSTCVFQPERAVAQLPAGAGESLEFSDASTNRSSAATVVDHAVSLYDKFDLVALDEIDLGDDLTVTVTGQVTDKRGPVSDGIVLLRLEKRGDKSDDRVPIVARARTDKDGRYKAQFSHSNLSASSSFYRVEILVADKQGRLAMDFRQFTNTQASDFSTRADLSLVSSPTLNVTIQSPKGQPLGGVHVSVQKAIATSNYINMDDPFARSDPFGRSLSSKTTHEFRFPDDRIRPTSITKENGKYDFSGAIGLTLSLEKEGLFRRTPELHTKTPRVSPHHDSHRSPAVIRLADEFDISTDVTDQFGNRIQDFKIRIGKAGWRLRQREDGSIATAATYLLESANDEGKTLVYVTFPETSGLLPVLKLLDVQTLLGSRHLKIEARKGVWLSGRVVKRDTRTGLESVWVKWNDASTETRYKLHQSVTDAEGYWKLLAPRRRGLIEISGIIPGYDLGGGVGVDQAAGELTQEVKPGDAAEMSVPDFEVRPTPTRTVVVVDARGRPVHGAHVSAEHSVTYRDFDGQLKHYRGTLAKRTQTDASGTCELKLTRTVWKDGIVKVSTTYWPYKVQPKRYKLTQSGEAEIKSESVQPIKVVLNDHVHLRGRVMVDGKPCPEIRVGLATRAEKSGPFNEYNHGYFKTSNGAFEFQMEPTGEYAIMLCLLADESKGERHYYHQTPVTKSNSKTLDVGTIKIQLHQLEEVSSDSE